MLQNDPKVFVFYSKIRRMFDMEAELGSDKEENDHVVKEISENEDEN